MRSIMLPFLASISLLALGACGGNEAGNDLASLDARLTNSGDPAVNGALADPIVVDPDLTQQSNQNSLRPSSRPVDGAVPMPLANGATRSDQARRAEELARAELGGTMERAPAPVRASACTDCDASRPLTLGALARQQKAGPKGCSADLSYGANWAGRMPDGFSVYPQARLVEAAGVMNGTCNVRVISFTTPASIRAVVDYYYNRARRAGYGAEYEIRGSDHMLGGLRASDEAAFVVIAQDNGEAATAVQIVASNGR